jgi:hypothetical protein
VGVVAAGVLSGVDPNAAKLGCRLKPDDRWVFVRLSAMV